MRHLWIHPTCVSVLLGVAAMPVAADRLPMAWPAGEQREYHAHWKRQLRPPISAEPAGMNAEQTGTVRVQVTRPLADGVALKWLPRLAAAVPGAGRAPEPTDAIWRIPLRLDLELKVRPDAAEWISLVNAEAVSTQVYAAVRALFDQVGLTFDCSPRDGSTQDVLCQQIGTPAGVVNWVLRGVEPFFACTALDFPEAGRVEWTQDHDHPAIGSEVPMRYVRELIEGATGDATVRIRTTIEPDAEKLKAWWDKQLAAMAGLDPGLQAQLSGLRYRFVTDCTVEVASGWPVRVEKISTGSLDTPFEGTETLLLEAVRPIPGADPVSGNRGPG